MEAIDAMREWRMRVLHVVERFDDAYGGPSRSIAELIDSLRQFDVESVVLSTKLTASSVNTRAGELGVESVHVRSWKLRNLYLAPRFRGTMATLLDRHRFDVIHLHSVWSMPSLVAMRMAQRRGIPLILSPRSSLYRSSLQKSAALKSIFRWLFVDDLLRVSACVHATSVEERNEVDALGIVRRLEVIPNAFAPVDTRSWSADEAKQRLGLPRDRRYILYLSRLNERKQVDLLIRAFSASNVGPDWGMIVCGDAENPKYENTLRQIVRDLGLADRVLFFGPVVGEKRTLAFQAAELFVLPSKFENFGMSIAEALSAGLPVIVSKFTPWKPVADLGAGWIIDPTVEGITESLSAACSQPMSDLSEKGARGREYVESNFSPKSVAASFADVYRSVIATRSIPSYSKGGGPGAA